MKYSVRNGSVFLKVATVLFLILFGAFLKSQDEVYLQILVQRIEIRENNHVGNEWKASLFVNDEDLVLGLKQSGIVKLTPNSPIYLEAYAEEGNEEYIDFGSRKHTITWENYKEALRFPLGMTVIVEESNGRYAGSKAKLRFQLYIHPTINEKQFEISSLSFTKSVTNPDYQREDNRFIYYRKSQLLTHVGPNRTRYFKNAYIDKKDNGNYYIGFDKTEDGLSNMSIDFDKEILRFGGDLRDEINNTSYFMSKIKVYKISSFTVDE
jgi:hypothetical protein